MKKRFIFCVCLLCLFSTSSLAFAAEPEIIWIESPAEKYTVWYYSYQHFNDLRYQPAEYGDGLYSITCLEGELDYTALSPNGCGYFYRGYVNQSGEWVLPPIYYNGYAFSNGIALVRQVYSEKKPTGEVWESILERIIHRDGKPIDGIDQFTKHGYQIRAVGNSRVILSIRENLQTPIHFAMTDLDGTLLLPATFLTVHLPSDGLCLVQTENGYGFYDANGKLVISPQYQDGKDFSQGLAAVRQNEKWGYINQNGEEIIPFVYDDVQSFAGDLAAVQLDGKWGYIDLSGQIKISPIYDEVTTFSEGVASVCQDGLWGAINQFGHELLPCQYQAVEVCSDNRIAVKWQNRYGYFNSTGEKVIDFLYGAATDFHEGFAVVSTGDFSDCQWESYWHIGMTPTAYHDNRFGVIDRWGNHILAEEYLCISDFEDGTAICQRASDKKVGIIHAPEVRTEDPGKRNFIRLYLNDQLLQTNQSPIMQNNRIYIPVHMLSEILPVEITWDESLQTFTIQNKNSDDTIVLSINETMATVNENYIALDVPVEMIDGEIMLPLRFFTEQFSCQIQWDMEHNCAFIFSPE